jgi:uncharacterized protein
MTKIDEQRLTIDNVRMDELAAGVAAQQSERGVGGMKINQKKPQLTVNERAMMLNIRNVSTTLRRDTINKLLNPTRDINYACNWPDIITIEDYKAMYDRFGLAKRVVKIWPEESWKLSPIIYETEKSDETEFERVFKELSESLFWFHYLERIDVLSGIGRFGCLLLGLADGEDLSQPVQGINEETGEKIGTAQNELLFLRCFDESLIEIKTSEGNTSSPRYGMPKMYGITFEDTQGNTKVQTKTEVHWTRVIHIADNRETSEVFGIPRMKDVYNHLLDIRKICGGSAEMFWKGGFPGYNFKIDPELDEVDIDTNTLKEQIRLYSEDLQRYMALVGVSVESLQPQVADPKGHFESHVKMIGMSKGVPWRLLLGSEEAKLASSQDKETWNERVDKRRKDYISPMIIRNFTDRLIAIGVLPEPVEYFIDWPDLNAPTEKDIAETALKRTEGYAKYIQGNVDQVIPPKEYHMTIQKMTEDEADALEQAAMSYDDELGLHEQPEQQPQPGQGNQPQPNVEEE